LDKTCKSFAITLVLLLIASSASLLLLKPINAQTISKPSVPDFTLKYVDSSTYIQPVYSTDQYTGKLVITKEGFYQQNKSIVLTITNLPFTTAMQDQNLSLFYQIEYKGSYGEYWSNLNQSSSNSIYVVSEDQMYLLNPKASYTTTPIGFSGNNGTARYDFNHFIDDIPEGGQIEFRIRAFVGFFTKVYEYEKYVSGIPVNDPTDPVPHYLAFTGETSSWSNIQTLSVPDGKVTAFESTNPTPTVPEFSPIAISLLIFLPSLVAVLAKRKLR